MLLELSTIQFQLIEKISSKYNWWNPRILCICKFSGNIKFGSCGEYEIKAKIEANQTWYYNSEYFN